MRNLGDMIMDLVDVYDEQFFKLICFRLSIILLSSKMINETSPATS